MKLENWKEFIVYSVLTVIIVMVYYSFKEEMFVTTFITFLGGVKTSEIMLDIVKSLKL